MSNFTINMLLERETKGAVRYQEVDTEGKEVPMDQAQIGTLYIRKRALETPPPKAVQVSVKSA